MLHAYNPSGVVERDSERLRRRCARGILSPFRGESTLSRKQGGAAWAPRVIVVGGIGWRHLTYHPPDRNFRNYTTGAGAQYDKAV